MKFVFSISAAKVGETAGLGIDDLRFVISDTGAGQYSAHLNRRKQWKQGRTHNAWQLRGSYGFSHGCKAISQRLPRLLLAPGKSVAAGR
jgi:hypothetical protein